MRKIASQIPDQVGRLLQAGHIKTPPTWYAPVLANPPPQIAPLRQRTRKPLNSQGLPLPTRDGRPADASVGRSMQAVKLRIREIRYREDQIRRQFFTDFPFEAFRPVTMVELRGVQEEHAIRGSAWTSLGQRGAYPTVEDTIEYTIKLQDEGLSLSRAYQAATEEFVQLRGKYEMASLAAEYEARHHGATFSPNSIERHFKKERRYLDSHLDTVNKVAQTSSDNPSWKKPKPQNWSTHIPDSALKIGTFARGQNYISQWAKAREWEDEAPEPIQDTAAVETSESEEQVTKEQPPVETPATQLDEEGMDDLEFLKSFNTPTKGKD